MATEPPWEGLTLYGVWTEEGTLAQPQADLFSGWRPCSGSFPESGLATAAGVFSMANSTPWPKGGGGYSACSLAATLETEQDWLGRNPGKTSADFWSYLRRYFLSARAAAGILRRAEARGRALPAALESALRQLASGNEEAGPTPAAGSLEEAWEEEAVRAHGGPKLSKED